MAQHLMIVPSLACPAGCKYCFGPHQGTQSMDRTILKAIIGWQKGLRGKDSLEITFHGGEPLVPGAAFYREALPLLKESLAPRRVRFAIQSNLWLLNDELCDLFGEYRVSIGTSLDGPEKINDAQRGTGYFNRTWAGIQLAQKHGLHPGCICTFTALSLPHQKEIFDFFLRKRLDFSVHSALPSLRYADKGNFALSAEEHGDLLVGMLDLYLANMDKIKISTLDGMIRSVGANKGGICTFCDCLGGYLAVGPDGGIYPCQRFAGMSEYRIGNVFDCPSWEEMNASKVWQQFQERQEHIKEECGDCIHFDYCRGGCPYNALVKNNGSFALSRDPDCNAYQRTFGVILEKAMAEVFAPENMAVVIQEPNEKDGLLRRGKLLNIMRGGPHPTETAGYARRFLAAVALAATNSAVEATRRLKKLAVFSHLEERAIEQLHWLLTVPGEGLNNLYLHITFNCNLHCTHCYAAAGPGCQGVMAIGDLKRVCLEAAELGFRHAVITGGEPLSHPDRYALFNVLAGLRQRTKPLLIVLRTNLAQELDRKTLEQISRSTDQVVVSVDGDRETHDARRGRGSYDLTVKNLRNLLAIGGDTDISLATVLPLTLINGAPGASVRALAKELGIRRTRFKPLLPLGRALETEPDIVQETLWGYLGPEEMVSYGFTPTASCGMGQNLYVEPVGAAYPCYAWCSREWYLGNIHDAKGLQGVLNSPGFLNLKYHTVNSNRLCRECCLRFLCGGACRAWNRLQKREGAVAEAAGAGLDDPPLDCSALHGRARSLLMSALQYFQIEVEEWHDIGFSIPEGPPSIAEAEGQYSSKLF